MKRLACAAFFSLSIINSTLAADFYAVEYGDMEARAQKTGAVPVLVSLSRIDFKDIAKNPVGYEELGQLKAREILNELGAEVLSGGSTAPELGIMTVWVTPRGLKLLQASKTVASIAPGPDWNQQIVIPNLDGSLSAIEAMLSKNDFVEVELTLDVDGAEFDIGSDTGKSTLKIASAAQRESATEKSLSLSSAIGLSSLKPLATSRSRNITLIETNSIQENGTMRVKANRIGLFELTRLPALRAIKPIDYVDLRPPTIDGEATKMAQKYNEVDVLIQLNAPYLGGDRSPATFKAQSRSNERMLSEMLAPYKMLREPKYQSLFGIVSARLNSADYLKLSTSKDKRLAGIMAVKPYFQSSMATSSQTMNLQGYWAAGYYASGQTIVILDSGVKKAHEMLTEKVAQEGCFQSGLTNPYNGFTYVSDCPDKDLITGDSPWNTFDSGEPLSATDCQSLFKPAEQTEDFYNRGCGHGTHVASIAAGNYSSEMSTPTLQVQGVAPGAAIWAVNVNSRSTSPPTGPGNGLWVLNDDMIEAMSAIANATTEESGIYPFTINMSFGSGEYRKNVPTSLRGDSSSFFGAGVSTLYGKGVASIAATGNNGRSGVMHEPAIVPYVIKVGATRNELNSHKVSDLTNTVEPNNFTGEHFFMAPGGDYNIESKVSAAKAYDGSYTSTYAIQGTSMAAPQVAGIFAQIKAVFPAADTAAVANFITMSMSEPTLDRIVCNKDDDDLPRTCRPFNFRQVKLLP